MLVRSGTQLLEAGQRTAVDRHNKVAGDDHVKLAQQRAARAGPGINAVGDEEYVVSVLLDLGTLVERPGVVDGQRMQAELDASLCSRSSLGPSGPTRRTAASRCAGRGLRDQGRPGTEPTVHRQFQDRGHGPGPTSLSARSEPRGDQRGRRFFGAGFDFGSVEDRVEPGGDHGHAEEAAHTRERIAGPLASTALASLAIFTPISRNPNTITMLAPPISAASTIFLKRSSRGTGLPERACSGHCDGWWDPARLRLLDHAHVRAVEVAAEPGCAWRASITRTRRLRRARRSRSP